MFERDAMERTATEEVDEGAVGGKEEGAVGGDDDAVDVGGGAFFVGSGTTSGTRSRRGF